MKHYEVLFILKPTLTEDEVRKRVDFVKEILTKNGGEIETVQPMGTRKLAYAIKKYERGTYFVIYFKAPPTLIAELQRVFGITEEIIRFLIVKYESQKEISAWEKLSKGFKFSKKEPKPERFEGDFNAAKPENRGEDFDTQKPEFQANSEPQEVSEVSDV